MMITRAAEMYVFRNMIGAYTTIILIIIGIILAIIHFIKKRHDEKPMTFFLTYPKFAHDCLNDEKWLAKNPNFSKQLKKELEKRGL